MDNERAKKKPAAVLRAFEAFHKHQNDPSYPYMLANTIAKTTSDLQKSRAFQLLGEWRKDYTKLSEINKFKHAPYLPKVRAILVSQFVKDDFLYFCMGQFYFEFHEIWKEFNEILKELFEKQESLALKFLWYICFNFANVVESKKLHEFSTFLSRQFEQSLRLFAPKNSAEAHKLLQIIYLLNLQELQTDTFGRNSEQWATIMQRLQGLSEGEQLQEGNTTGNLKLEVMLGTLLCKNILSLSEKSNLYWLSKIDHLLLIIQGKIEKMSINNKLDQKILDTLLLMLKYSEVVEIITKDETRYSKSLLQKMKTKYDQVNFPFNYEKYAQIRDQFYRIFYHQEPKKVIDKVEYILKEILIKRTQSELNEDKSSCFIDNISEKPILINDLLIYELIKYLSNNHYKKALQPKQLILLIKLLKASLHAVSVPGQMITALLKSLLDCLNLKSDQTVFWELRGEIARLFHLIVNKFDWDEQRNTDIVLRYCEEYERNTTKCDKIIMQIMVELVKKHTTVLLSTQFFPRLEGVVRDMTSKLKEFKDQQTFTAFLSLILAIYQRNKWNQAEDLIGLVCKWTSPSTKRLFQFQADALMKSNQTFSPNEEAVILQLIRKRENWETAYININLNYLQIIFLKLSPEQAYKLLRIVDKSLLQLMTELFEEETFHLFTHISSKMFPAVRDLDLLTELESYNYMKQKAFDMLARSFNKTSILCMNYFFCAILLKSKDIVKTFLKLNTDNFLDYLFRGLNDFITKEKKYDYEFVIIMQCFRIMEQEPEIYYPETKLYKQVTIFKNVAWWIEAGCPLIFEYFVKESQNISLFLIEFKEYYQQTIKDSLKKITQSYLDLKTNKLKKQISAEEDELII